MPSPVQNFSRPFRPKGRDETTETIIELPEPIKPPKATRAPSTRNVLRKKAPVKSLRRMRISEPSVDETFQDICQPEVPSRDTPLCHAVTPQVLPELEVQARRGSRRHSEHPMPLASHPDTMSFVSAPSSVSLPDLSTVPCLNSYSISHGLTCGHVVRAPVRDACGRNCDSVHGHGRHGAIANEPFICQACINNLLDSKYEQKRARFVQNMCPTWPFLGTGVDSIARKKVKDFENGLEVERAKDERMLLKLGRYSYAASYS